MDQEPMIAAVMKPLTPKPSGLGILKMRPYQIAATDAIYREWERHRATLCVLPTGMGKTVVAAETICRAPGEGRWLFLSHLREINYQTVSAIERHLGETPSLEMGMHREERLGHGVLDRSRVLVASVQTMVSRMRDFQPEHFDGVIFDEAHHAAAVTYRKIWQYFSEGNSDLRALLITATPNRADGLSIGCIATSCAIEIQIKDGIADGWLVPVQQKFVRVHELRFDGLKTRRNKAGEQDFSDEDLARVMGGEKLSEELSEQERLEALKRAEQICHRIAEPTIREAQGRQGIVFCASVAQAERMAEVLRRHPGVTAREVVGSTDEDERREIVEDFRAGKVQFLCLCQIGTEGFDAPGVELVVMARPTKSEALYKQMLGRGTRPVAGLVDQYETAEERRMAIANSRKPHMTVLDFVGVSGRHKLISTLDVLAGEMPEELRREVAYEMAVSGETADAVAKGWEKKRKRDEEEQRRRAEAEQRRREAIEREQERRAQLTASVKYQAEEVDPFSRGDVRPVTSQPVYRGGSTDKQIELLMRLGISREKAMAFTKAQAGAVIDKRQSQKGRDWIMRFGKHTGKTLADIQRESPDYFVWMTKNITNPEFLANVELFRQQWKRGER
jgi:superfamily II DNA or RNA helicase